MEIASKSSLPAANDTPVAFTVRTPLNIELHVTDKTDALRLRSQRRYFGITDYSDLVPESIKLAKFLGAQAKSAVEELLSEPFTLHTAFADGSGDGRYKRYYGCITLQVRRDLATMLVSRGLARAYGIYSSSPDGLNRDHYLERIRDTELRATARRQGTWQYTDWDRLIAQRDEQRREHSALDIATGTSPPTKALDLNTAARDELMRVPEIGEHFANVIIENGPYREVSGLLRVPGIGEKRLAKLQAWVKVER
jgi:hypothetical protein